MGRWRTMVVVSFVASVASSASSNALARAASDAPAPAITPEAPAVTPPAAPTSAPHEISLETAEDALRVARQRRADGDFIAAREQYLRITRAPLPVGAREARKVLQEAAKAELGELDGELAYVSVVVQGATTAPITVMRDNEELPRTSLGVPLPLLPGKHRFQASTAALRSMPVVVTLERGAVDTVVLTLGTPADDPAVAAAHSASKRPWRSATPSRVPPTTGGSVVPGDRSISERPLLLGALGALGVGVIGASAGGYFLLSSPSPSSEADALFNACHPTCTRSERDQISALDEKASTRRVTLGWSSLVVGVGGLITAGTLYVMDRNHEAVRRAQRITPVIGASYLGAAGTF